MTAQSALIAEDIRAYLQAQEEQGMLRFITCGSVDDGKSTLIGRLLWDSKLIFEDQLASLEADSKRVGTQGEKIDYALLMDGLQAEREQGITIDVAYRYFATDRRKFIVADTPGHEQYTRNMVTGASNAEVAVILVDARKGILTQTRRHSYLVSLVGIRKVVLTINKMDLVAYSQARFEEILNEYRQFAIPLGFDEIAAIPISALEGDNIISASPHTPWYAGSTLLDYLETVEVTSDAVSRPFRLPVQWVNRPNLDFRGFSGTITSGRVRPGDAVLVATSGRSSRVARIVTFDGDLPEALAGQAVTLTLEDEIDISRGDLLTMAETPPVVADHLEAKLVWLHPDALVPGRSCLLKAGTATVPARVAALQFRVNVNSLAQEPATNLAMNEVGVCTLNLDKPLAFDSYRENRGTGNFILIDRLSNATVAAGMIHQPLLRAAQGWTSRSIDRAARAASLGQKPLILWISGRDAATLAELVEKRLLHLGRQGYWLRPERLDPQADTVTLELLPRLAEIARILNDAGLIVLIAAEGSLSDAARARLGGSDFREILLDAPADATAEFPLQTGDSLERQAEQLVTALCL
ncbi:MAG: sulfate adenylyltransferase subunit CysN [Desulfuromonadales bacterium]|nr:sulfate adenylyltransferase subunit CysN [Desulfuromonadales bacterium]